jgi:diketogulonate reductase-like aldo/keto reductase
LKQLQLFPDNNELGNNHTIDTHVRVHVLLHWPYCRSDIAWMDCEGEEARLPRHVKEAGPPPHLDKQNAWRESWRALEDMYQSTEKQYVAIESIGVSNFDLPDLTALVELHPGVITPHIYQGNVWAFLFDSQLMQFCQFHNIHFQAYNVMNGIISSRAVATAPNAYQVLLDIAARGVVSNDATKPTAATPAQVVLAWLVYNGVSVIPRTSQLQHLRENANAVTKIPVPVLASNNNIIRNAVTALLRGIDLDRPRATFINKKNFHRDEAEDNAEEASSASSVHLFWYSNESGEEVPIHTDLQPGESYEVVTYPGHVFVAYDETKETRREYQVRANFGDAERIHIEL